MQTTLRIDDEIYRQAKAEAAREGVTLTQFIHEALSLRLGRSPHPKPAPLPSFGCKSKIPPNFDLVEAVRHVEESSDLEFIKQFEPK